MELPEARAAAVHMPHQQPKSLRLCLHVICQLLLDLLRACLGGRLLRQRGRAVSERGRGLANSLANLSDALVAAISDLFHPVSERCHVLLHLIHHFERLHQFISILAKHRLGHLLLFRPLQLRAH